MGTVGGEGPHARRIDREVTDRAGGAARGERVVHIVHITAR